MIVDSLDSLLNRAMAVANPPRKAITHREVALSLLLPDGPLEGKPYVPEQDPVHACLMEQLDAGWRAIVGVGAVQTGKSLALIMVPLLRSVIHMRQACVYSQPTKDKLHEAWAGKVLPSIDGAGLGEWLPKEGQGSRGGQTPKFVIFREPNTGNRAGMTYLIPGGGAREGAQAAVTAPTALIDEVDSYDDAHRIELIGKRCDAFGSRAVRVYTSTVKRDGKDSDTGPSIILGMYENGTASRLHFACPHCGSFQPLEWERVTYDPTDESSAAETARYSCTRCAAQWTEDERRVALTKWRMIHKGQSVDNDGVVIGEIPRVTTFSLLWTSLDSSLRSLPLLCQDHLRAARSLASGDHGPMRSFWRDQLCRSYRGDIEGTDETPKLEVAALLLRSSLSVWGSYVHHSDRDEAENRTFSRHIAPWPDGAAFGSIGVDVQQDRLYWSLIGMDHERRTWDIGWGYEYATPDRAPMSRDELHRVLDRVNALANEIAGDHKIPVRGCDTNFRTDDLIPWFRINSIWLPCYGASAAKSARIIQGGRSIRDFPGILSLRRSDDWELRQPRHHIDTNSMRQFAQMGFLQHAGEVGAAHLANGLGKGRSDTAYLNHLCGEMWDDGKRKWVKPPGARRHDWLDCRTYACALAIYYLEVTGRFEHMRKQQEQTAAISGSVVRPPDPPSASIRSTLSIRKFDGGARSIGLRQRSSTIRRL